MSRSLRYVLTAAVLTGVALSASAAPQVRTVMPLGRSTYQTNEQIDVDLVRSDATPLAASPVALTLTGGDGSKLAFTFAGHAAGLSGSSADVTEHLHVNGWLLRPGNYNVEALVDGVT